MVLIRLFQSLSVTSVRLSVRVVTSRTALIHSVCRGMTILLRSITLCDPGPEEDDRRIKVCHLTSPSFSTLSNSWLIVRKLLVQILLKLLQRFLCFKPTSLAKPLTYIPQCINAFGRSALLLKVLKIQNSYTYSNLSLTLHDIWLLNDLFRHHDPCAVTDKLPRIESNTINHKENIAII